MADTGLSESCPAGALTIRAKPEFTCGYLNVKTLQLGPEKKSRDRSWYCYWTQVSGDCLLFYKVESLSSHASSTSPPPADKECPLKPHMQETDRLLLTGALVEMEYTYKADQKHRRRYLFRITLESGADYLLQAPSDGAAISWTATLRDLTGRFSQDSNKSTDLMQMIFLKSARVYKKGEVGKAPPTIITKPPPPLDPAVLHLKDKLQKKVDLLYHLKQMEATFCSHQRHQTRTPSPSPDITPHQPSTEDDTQSVSSASDSTSTSTGRNSRSFDKREATVLSDYYMIAGAKWSVLEKGETVTVLQELPTGYYLVKATRHTKVDLTTPKVKRNISDSILAGRCDDTTAPASNHTTPEQRNERSRRVSQGTPTILIEQSSNSSLVPSDSFQSNISDDSGIVEGAKRTSNISGKDDDEDKSNDNMVGSDGSNGYLQMSKVKTATYAMSLPRNFAPVGDKLTASSAGSDNIPNSVSCGNFSEVADKKDCVSLPLLGSVPPSILSCYADQLFHPTVKSTQSNPIQLQQPPVRSPSTAPKKKKQTTRGNRLSLQVDSFSDEASPTRKSSTLPHNGVVSPSIAKPERGKSGFKSFFKKRLSSYERSSSISSGEGDADKDHLSIQKETTPVDIQRVQSPVYEYTPVTDSGEQFRRRGQSFVYAIGESSSDDDSDAEGELSEKHLNRVRRKKAISGSSRNTPPSSNASSNSPPKDETCLFEMSVGESSHIPQRRDSRTKEDSPASPTGTESKKSPEKSRKSLKKVHSLPVNVSSKDANSDEAEKRVHRLSVGDVPSVEIAIRAPPLNKRRHVYLDATVLKFGFRLETYGRSTFLGDVMDTVVYTVTQGTAAFLAGLYPGDVILEVEGEDVSNKNCNDLGKIIASYKEKLQVICLTVKFIDGVKRLDLLKADMEQMQKNRNSTASSEGDSSDTDTDNKKISGPLSPELTGPPGLGRISETTEEEGMLEEEEEDYTPQVMSPSQA
ncbi:uncharacterized protein [Dysidea avara]